METMTTVYCAVWHKDEKRHDLIRAHRANLARQTRPVKVIYVFDGGDPPPADLDADLVCCSQNLSIYEAWNVALTVCRTPFVMNLNLDDRLAPNAVEHMEAELMAQQADLIGGDWKICFTQEDTDRVQPVYSANTLPFLPAWPPEHGRETRLGSGSGDRGTYGPATLWRMEVHTRIPRYPHRTVDGMRILSVSDAVFWHMLKVLGMKLARTPMIVGQYYSHPESQAEFRAANEMEEIVKRNISLI